MSGIATRQQVTLASNEKAFYELPKLLHLVPQRPTAMQDSFLCDPLDVAGNPRGNPTPFLTTISIVPSADGAVSVRAY